MEETTRTLLGSSPTVGEQDDTALESIQLTEEIQGIIAPAQENASSFTALLELPPTQAMELLHSPDCDGTSAAASASAISICQINDQKPYLSHSFNGNLTFPSNTALIERAAKFSAFAGENSTTEEASSVFPNSSANLDKVKNEPPETDSNPSSTQGLVSDLAVENKNQRATKRKEREKKVKGSAKKSKNVADETSGDAEKLPYVHVRVRRGQATDSHSLAERARREKINARMKLLQELVPGCNKISGTALVLDEIINHVQSLQRQVEFLSMKLAAVNPRIDFSLDSVLATEVDLKMSECVEVGDAIGVLENLVEKGALLTDSNFHSMVTPLMWPEMSDNGNRQQYQQQWQYDAFHQPLGAREEDNHNFMASENSLLSYDSSANSASLHSNQLKMEL